MRDNWWRCDRRRNDVDRFSKVEQGFRLSNQFLQWIRRLLPRWYYVQERVTVLNLSVVSQISFDQRVKSVIDLAIRSTLTFRPGSASFVPVTCSIISPTDNLGPSMINGGIEYSNVGECGKRFDFDLDVLC